MKIEAPSPESNTHPVPESSSPYSSMPVDPSPKDIPKVSTLDMSLNDMNNLVYTLSFKKNCGKPPNRYSLDVEEQRLRYPIINCVYQKFIQPRQSICTCTFHKSSSS